MASHSLDVLARLSAAVPETLAARAAAWTSADRPVPATPSASVVLLRDSEGVVETYLLHRHARMSFAASMVVFPGGRVDPADTGATTSPDPIRACALRETAEETGVELADQHLMDWAHWTTPEVEPRRYDTHFFVAALPAGQQAHDISGETDRAAWSTPSGALAAQGRGEVALMPPTVSILLELAEVSSVADVFALALGRAIEPVLPVIVAGADGWSFRYPRRCDHGIHRG